MKPRYILIIVIFSLFIVGCNKKEYNDIGENSMKNINIILNGTTYKLVLEDNDTAKEFTNLLPNTFYMKELNGNEKYVYLDSTLKTNSHKPEKINKGDVYLYGNNCLVIFYKSFNTNYSYTKIGHIDNLPDLDNSDITVIMEVEV